MTEPQDLASGFANLISRYPPGHRLHQIGQAAAIAKGQCLRRRAAVLRHDDLRRQLETELGYHDARQWNGWIPPAVIDPWSPEDLCRSAQGKLNQRAKYARCEDLNNSPRREALLRISAEAWEREHRPPVSLIKAH